MVEQLISKQELAQSDIHFGIICSIVCLNHTHAHLPLLARLLVSEEEETVMDLVDPWVMITPPAEVAIFCVMTAF